GPGGTLRLGGGHLGRHRRGGGGRDRRGFGGGRRRRDRGLHELGQRRRRLTDRGGHRNATLRRLFRGDRRLRRRFGWEVAGVDPGGHADAAERGLGFRLAEVDVGLQGVQWHPTLAVPF